MNVKKIITLLLALVLAAGMVACGTKPAEDTDGKDGSEEAKALYEQLMAQENAILSENTALWEKVFMAADKGMAMICDVTSPFVPVGLQLWSSYRQKHTNERLPEG